MTELNKILHIIKTLQKEQVDFVVVGGIAVILYGMPRTSEDLDIILEMSQKNINLLRSALRKLFNDDDIKEITYEELEEYAVIRYVSPDDDVIDIIAKMGESFDYNSINFQDIDIDGIIFKIATPETLIQMKSDTYREKDTLDILYLKEYLK